jgi:hypothetical protein
MATDTLGVYDAFDSSCIGGNGVSAICVVPSSIASIKLRFIVVVARVKSKYEK